ncbi:Kinetochore-associated protein 1 [Holothuria leucospilota]|uniref:Kinetochore-associated protein 1 n=1 Tax=Holothuria leucospilota TaxID=206669 RepID=A0A9Q1CGT4_HOLLE|nr:Kinetochore-associated protein 1 [Holothuria leucospilota]
MEIRDKTSWPSNGIKLLQLFFHAYQTYTRIGQASGSDNSELIGQLQTVLGQLTGLKNLKERYNCYLSLQLYTQKDVTSIAFVMLDRVVAMELVSKVIKNQVKPYAEHNHLNFDKLLHQYITHHCNSFESRTIAISEYITDIELHLQSVLFMMKRAQLPWSKALQDLVQASLKVDHPVADQLRDNYKLIELGKMLSEYKLGHIDLRNLEFVEVAIYNILQRDGPSVVDHALQLVEIQNKMKPLDVYLIRMQSLLKQNKLDECFDLLHNLEGEMHVKCAKRMTTYGQTYLSEPLPWSLTKEDKQRRLTYCQATIKFLRILLKQSDASVQTVNEWTDLQRHIQCIQELQAEFGVFHHLHDDRSKQEKCEELSEFYNNYDSWKESQGEEESFMGRNPQRPPSGKDTSSCKKISIITRFGKCLGLTEEEVKGHIAMEALQKRNLKEAISRCRDLCEPGCSTEGARVIFDVLQSICQLGGRCSAKQASAIQRALGSSTNLFKTLYDLACIALTCAESDDICDLSELCKHLRFLRDLEKQCETGDYGNTVEIPDSETDAFSNPAWLMEDFFVEDSLVLESGQVLPKAGSFITSCIPSNHMQTTQYQDCRLLGMPVPTCQNTDDGEKSPNTTLSCRLPKLQTTSDDLIQYLMDNQHHQLAFTVVVEAVMTGTAYLDANTLSPSLLSTQMMQGIGEEMKSLKTLMGSKMVISENCASHLLDKIFEAENVDKSLALSFLLVLNKSTATKKLQQLETSAGFNYKKVMVIAEVGHEFAVVSLEDENLQKHYQQVQKLASWGQQLRKLKISFKDAFKKPVSAEFEKLLPVISTHHQVDFDLVKDFCRDFNLNADQAMLMFITQTLLPSDQYKKGASVNSHEELDVKKLENAILEIQDKNLLLNNLVDILQKVDSYDYERIGFILRTLKEQFPLHQEEAVNKQLELLAHLQVYKRISPPSVTEVSQQTSDDSEISDECKNRLPFHALLKQNVWKILSKELIDTTVEQLLPVTQLLKLPSDQVYVTTIQNIILKTKENPAAANASQKLERGKSSVYLEMLEAIKLLLVRVENSQMAVATARAVAKEIPKGPEKVVAFKICIMLAENWVKTTAEDSQEREKAKVTLHYLEEKYRLLATERVLCKYNLDEAKHLQLVNSPKELIVILYQHGSIVSRIKGEITMVPDIHTTAEAIAKINDCNLNEIHQMLLKRWLCKPTTTQEVEEEDMTVDLSSINGMEKEDGSEEDEEKSLMRIKYLLQLQNPKGRVELLLKMAYDESSTFSTKLRTLKCLFDMADSEMLESVSGKTCQQLWEHLQNVAYLSDLESLNFNLDLKTFLQANKQGLVRGMLRKHSQEPKALKLIADLCLKYEVMDVNLWNHLLQQMAKYNMFDDLESTLHCISTISDLQQIPSLGTIWWNMLLQPFKTVRAPLSEEEKAVCRKSLILLHSCPVTCDLDVITLHNHFKKIDMLPEALACLFHLPVTEKSQSVEKFLKTVGSTELGSQLTALKNSHHLLPESQMIEEVLSQFGRPVE